MVGWLTSIWSWCFDSGKGTLYSYYADTLRGDFFNAGLTLGGFLLAAYTFIVIHMKTSVFDSEEYKGVFEHKKRADPRLRRYQPLRTMSDRLFRAVVVTLGAGVLQLTLGLYEANIAALLCIAAGAVAVIEVSRSVLIMSANLRTWFESIDPT